MTREETHFNVDNKDTKIVKIFLTLVQHQLKWGLPPENQEEADPEKDRNERIKKEGKARPSRAKMCY